MKIIDSNKDYYDYIQSIYRDDTFIFDRRDSYVLKKEEFADHFDPCCYGNDGAHGFVLLQICNKFWLFLLTVTCFFNGNCLDYDLSLIGIWNDYSTKREMIKLSKIYFGWQISDMLKKDNFKIDEKMFSVLRSSISRNDYEEINVFNRFSIWKGRDKEVRHIPILRNIGIASLVSPEEIYFALEEYFSLEKTASERTESIGLTNNEKILNHGFNLKDSFRGKA